VPKFWYCEISSTPDICMSNIMMLLSHFIQLYVKVQQPVPPCDQRKNIYDVRLILSTREYTWNNLHFINTTFLKKQDYNWNKLIYDFINIFRQFVVTVQTTINQNKLKTSNIQQNKVVKHLRQHHMHVTIWDIKMKTFHLYFQFFKPG
jgi:hypothetical protein